MLLLLPNDFEEAGGKLTGKIDNAALGLSLQTDSTGKTWAWNPTNGQWCLVYKLKEGDNLWSLAGKFYGTNARWVEIRDLAQNKPIVGSSGADAFGGDTILIPGLPQPFPPPAAGVPAAPLPPAVVPTTAPSIWPAGVPWPGAAPSAEPAMVPAVFPGETLPAAAPGAPVAPSPNGAAAKPGAEPSFWTPGKIAVAAGAGAIGVGLIVYLATRKKRRNNPRRRRR